MGPHLLVCVSAHGYGHIGQTAPVLDELRRRLPGLRVTVRSEAPGFKLFERFGAGIEHQSAELDVGMIQRNALDLNIDASADAYRAFHACWPERVSTEAAVLRRLQPDLLLANVPYLSLAAAHRADIPAVALCSLCWSDIYRYFFQGTAHGVRVTPEQDCRGRHGHSPLSAPHPGGEGDEENLWRDFHNNLAEAETILDQMLEGYNSAALFLQPEPRMPMHGIRNGQPIGPIAQLGQVRRAELLNAIGASKDDKLIMVSLGGMEARLPIESWKDLTGFRFIVPKDWETTHPRATAFEDLGMCFADALASCDALIAKPGYGSFVEAACLGIPILYVERPNWPEVPFLVDWLELNGRCQVFDAYNISHGDFRSKLEALWSTPAPHVQPHGIDQAADYLVALLDGGSLR